MKKHIVLIMNAVLVTVILGAIIFTVLRLISSQPVATEPTQPAAAQQTQTAGSEPVTVPAGERYKVGIVQHAANPDSDNCYAGFISQLNDRGLLSNVEIVYIVEEDNDRCKAEIQRLVDEGCDLLYTIGPFASKAAAAVTDQIPVVFASVSDPEEAGLVNSNEEPGGTLL